MAVLIATIGKTTKERSSGPFVSRLPPLLGGFFLGVRGITIAPAASRRLLRKIAQTKAHQAQTAKVATTAERHEHGQMSDPPPIAGRNPDAIVPHGPPQNSAHNCQCDGHFQQKTRPTR